jgi:hypothetical protein
MDKELFMSTDTVLGARLTDEPGDVSLNGHFISEVEMGDMLHIKHTDPPAPWQEQLGTWFNGLPPVVWIRSYSWRHWLATLVLAVVAVTGLSAGIIGIEHEWNQNHGEVYGSALEH